MSTNIAQSWWSLWYVNIFIKLTFRIIQTWILIHVCFTYHYDFKYWSLTIEVGALSRKLTWRFIKVKHAVFILRYTNWLWKAFTKRCYFRVSSVWVKMGTCHVGCVWSFVKIEFTISFILAWCHRCLLFAI